MGRRPKSALTYNDAAAEQTDPQEAANEAFLEREETRAEQIAEGKAQTIPVGYEFRPYYNRPEKQKKNLAKLILVQKNQIRGHIYRSFIARNVPMSEAQKLMMLSGDALTAEHERRGKLPRYGF